MSFPHAVSSISSIASYYKSGLQALGPHSNKVIPHDSRRCDGSVDLDTGLKQAMPNEHRWDYVLGYNGKSYFMEVHPASGQATEVIRKATWLRAWLKGPGKPLLAILHDGGNFHWIPTGGVKIIGKDRLRLAQAKVVIERSLRLR